MRIKFLALATLAALTISSAQAETGQANTWTLHDVVFDDLTTATGTFSVDALANLTSFDITTQQAGDYPGMHYTYTEFSSFFSDKYSIYIESSSKDSFVLGLSSPTNSNVASIGVVIGQERHFLDRFLITDRFIGSGSITTSVSSVPEPETYALMLAGLSIIGFFARGRKSP